MSALIARSLPVRAYRTRTQLRLKKQVLRKKKYYKTMIILKLYLFTTLNIIIFDSITKFPCGLLSAAIVTFINEKCSTTIYKLLTTYTIVPHDIAVVKTLYYSQPIFIMLIILGIINLAAVLMTAY
ncbi:unnamed protein product [Rotaria sp. Silwood2]|nr:unnamed protein product [Rotaria sp. Silwood2]CAF4277835.1 unnamed protein product [Rotaria sp. Silwood2]